MAVLLGDNNQLYTRDFLYAFRTETMETYTGKNLYLKNVFIISILF